MNASVTLLESSLPASVHLHVDIDPAHASASILGTERAGSGTLVDPAGLILTVQYIVLGAARIEVTLIDGTRASAGVVAQDFATGLAVLKLDGRKAPAARLAPSTTLERGHEVFLLASASGDARRVGTGVVSSLAPYDAYWEYRLERGITSTAMNPGLSGGAMFDRLGRMVGVVSLDLNEVGRFTLAIPVEYFLDYRDELLRHGRRTSLPPRAWIGVYCYALQERVVIAGILPGTPAEVAGMKAGDVLLTVDGEEIRARDALYRRLWQHRPGDQIQCTVFRGDGVESLAITAGDAEQFFA